MELLPSMSIGWKISINIARQIEELSLISLHSFVALDKVAKFSSLACNNCLRDVAGVESNLEFFPGDDSSRRQSLSVSGPPLSCGTLQEVSCKRDIPRWRDRRWFTL